MMTVDEFMEMVRLARENSEPEIHDGPAAFPELMRIPATSEGWRRSERAEEADWSLQRSSP
jgi:hypothetical protein